MKVVLAEKPSVAKDLAKVLGATQSKEGYLEGNGYQVTWAIGHLIKLADSSAYGFEKWSLDHLPILPDKFILQVVDDKKKQFNAIKKLFSEAEEIIVATDAGREGELIFRYIYQAAGSKKSFKRLWISSLTNEAITKGFRDLKPGKDYDSIFYSAQCRSQADWLVGINGTQALTLSAGSGKVLSVGRVQTPILALLCQRYLENTNFKPEAYYELTVKTEKNSVSFKAKHPNKFSELPLAEALLQQVTGELTVTKYETKESKEAAPRLFDLSSLQQKANQSLGFSADQTLQAAQQLYESKLITYPRTGSQYLSADMKAEIPAILKNLLGSEFQNIAQGILAKPLSDLPFNDKKVTDHHAIIPTHLKAPGDLDKKLESIYQLIVKRFLSAFSEACIKDITSVALTSGKVDFITSGFTIKHAGWRGVELAEETNPEAEEAEETQKIPPLTIGEKLKVLAKAAEKKFTKPKPIHTESTLLKLMETAGKEVEDEELKDSLKECGIGTPATRASIIETLLDRSYIIREKKKLVPTELGLSVYHLLKDKLIAKVDLTGSWERMLNKMAEGAFPPEEFNSRIVQYTKELVNEITSSEISTLAIDKSECPRCKQPSLTFYDAYAKCSNNDCGLSFSKEIGGKKLSDTTLLKIIKTGKSGLIKGFKSKSSGKPYDAELIMGEDFKITFSFSNNNSSSESKVIKESFSIVCPKCKGETSINDRVINCKSCDFKFWRTIAKKEISQSQIIKLFKEGKTDEIKGFMSKTDKPFNGKIKFKEDFSTEFEFSNSK